MIKKITMQQHILVLNCGSSSVKYALYNDNEKELIRGIIEEIGTKIKDHKTAIEKILHILTAQNYIVSFLDIIAVGHRIVHGGNLKKSAVISTIILKKIKRASVFAPLHNPHNIEGIKAAQHFLPHAKNVAVFDTAFHIDIPEYAALYGIPLSISRTHTIKRYGFHGISYQHICQELKKKLGKIPSRLIVCHLGNGSSICAIKNGKSVDTSMGFTPAEGLMMGTRTGDIDPGIIFYLEKKGIKNVEHMLEYQSGLKAMTGTNDMKIIWKKANKGDKHCQRAIDMYCYRLQKYIGAYAAALHGIDAVVFTAGIGEHAWWIRKQVCQHLQSLGISLDGIKNKANQEKISTGKVAVYVLPTNEEIMILKEVKTVLRN